MLLSKQRLKIDLYILFITFSINNIFKVYYLKNNRNFVENEVF